MSHVFLDSDPFRDFGVAVVLWYEYVVYLVGGFNPSERYARQIWSFPQCENRKYLKPPPRFRSRRSQKPKNKWSVHAVYGKNPPPGTWKRTVTYFDLTTYCWWKESCTSWGWWFIPLFTRFCTSQGGAGFLNHQQYHLILGFPSKDLPGKHDQKTPALN